jgi:hypothetical protein
MGIDWHITYNPSCVSIELKKIMTKNTTSTATTNQTKPRRRGFGGGLFFFMILLLLVAAIATGGAGLFVPARLALVQEQTLALLHGGIASREEQTFVEGCVTVQGIDQPQAITRVRRETHFGDGTSLVVVFSSQPATNSACQ